MERITLNAQARTQQGKGAAKRLRKEGIIPAIMYDNKGQSTMISVKAADFYKVWRNITKTTSILLNVEGKEHIAYIQAVEYDIKTDKVLHADFRIVQKDQFIKAKYKVQYSGTPLGVREGGFMVKHLPQIALKATPDLLPIRITADVSNVKIGDTFLVKDLGLDKKIKLLVPETALLVTVAPPRAK